MKPSVRLLAATQLEPDFAKEVGSTNALKLVEFSGRWDYGAKSIAKMAPDDVSIIQRWMKQGEESMIEMVDAAFFIVCSRVVTHELVRHRAGMSYQQESQRFVSYEDEPVGNLFYVPEGFKPELEITLLAHYQGALDTYIELRGAGVSKQLARYVLPNATRTRIVAKGNLRSWRHILKLRMHSSAQPEMRIVAGLIREKLYERYPEVFEDVTGEERASR